MKLPLALDCQYLQSKYACSYLLTEGKEAIFVENNTTHSVPILLAALKAKGLRTEQVKYVIITHVHLDHAGGSSALMKACPQAQLLAHPRAAGHVIDPTQLVQSAKKVYGNVTFEKLYGQIDPIPANRVRAMQDGERLSFHSRTLEFFFTRGHANHHICIWDSESQGIFTGDSFGIAYPALQTQGLFIFPSTSPTQFDPAEARKSIAKILDYAPKRVFLTHFGALKNVRGAATQLLEHLDFSEGLLERATRKDLPEDLLTDFCKAELQAHFEKTLQSRGIRLTAAVADILQLDIQLNSAGIAHLANKLKTRS